MSCSTHKPKPLMAGDVTRVSLSRPFWERTPNTVPSQAPGFSWAGPSGLVLSRIWSARSISFDTSSPMTAAGTSPK